MLAHLPMPRSLPYPPLVHASVNNNNFHNFFGTFFWRRRRLKINSNLTLMLICKHLPSPSFHHIILSHSLTASLLLFSCCCLWHGRLLFCDVLYATSRTKSSGCSAQCENAEWGKLFSFSQPPPILICIFLNFHIICDIYCWRLVWVIRSESKRGKRDYYASFTTL